MIDLKGQTAIVTGGSRGIGRAIAVALAGAGAHVAITFSDDAAGALETKHEIDRFGVRSLAICADIAKMSDCRKAFRYVYRKMGRIDILVNNAGIWTYGEAGRMKEAVWHKTIDINLTGTFNMCNLIIPVMKRQKFGRIINISSTAGQRGEAFHSHYAASKGGIIAFTKSIAVELIRQGIWVNCVAPGWVRTSMTSGVWKKSSEARKIFDSIPIGRFATAEEIAGPILFLASPLSNYIVGEILNVNGGNVLCG